MFAKLKNYVTATVIYFVAILMKLLYKQELKELEQKSKTIRSEKAKQIITELKSEIAAMSPQQKVLADKALLLQNQLLSVFTSYLKEIRGLSGQDMNEIAFLWIETTQGLNTTVQSAFGHKSEKQIKEHIYALETELNLAVATNQEIIGTKSNGSNGGFGYNGPIGEA